MVAVELLELQLELWKGGWEALLGGDYDDGAIGAVVVWGGEGCERRGGEGCASGGVVGACVCLGGVGIVS